MYQQNKSETKVKFRQASNDCKRGLEAAKLSYANKTKESITFQKRGSQDFWQITNSVLNKDKSAICPLYNSLELLSSEFDKAKLFTENFFMNYSLDNSGISLTVFSSRTNVTLHTTSVTTKMVKKVITSLSLSQVSGPDCIPVVVFKKCESEVLYILA